MSGVYTYKGFYIIDNRNSYEPVEKDKSWYVLLNNIPKPIYFPTLDRAKKWCKANYIVGILNGWSKGETYERYTTLY